VKKAKIILSVKDILYGTGADEKKIRTEVLLAIKNLKRLNLTAEIKQE